MFLVIATIGAIMNRIRGGWLTDLLQELKILNKDQSVPAVKPINGLVFGLVFGSLLNLDYFQIIFLAAFVWGGGALGWGGYIDDIISRKINHNRDDVLILDKWFRGDSVPVLSGWAALSIRGFMWTSAIWLGFYWIYLMGTPLNPNFHFIPLIGLSMGSCYLLACTVCERLTFRGNGWQYGELLFGAVLWGSCAYFVL